MSAPRSISAVVLIGDKRSDEGNENGGASEGVP
jgi:hypothetical protein